MLEIEELCAQVGNFLLEEISLSIGEGQCHAVLGPSGSGKSTLLAAVLGTLPASAGIVRLGGRDITGLPMEQRQLGYVPQQLGLFPHLSVEDNLCFSARARRLREAAYRPLLRQLVEITGIGPLLDRRIGTLSGGERQRVALVRALVADPQLVLLDEPFTALNESLRRELWWLMKDLQAERGLTLMLVTHDLTEAYFLADHISVLIGGRQRQNGPRETVYHRPASREVARFLGIRNLFPATVAESGDGWIAADCAVLQARFRLAGEAQPGDRIWIGIRPEEVALRDADHPPRPGERTWSGQAHLIDMGAEAAVRLAIGGTGVQIEMAVSRRAVRRFGLTDGQRDVTVALPVSQLFWMPSA